MYARILVVEDDAGMQGEIRETFENDGYEVIAAGDFEQACAKYNQEHPDLIVLDVEIPGRDGYLDPYGGVAVLREIRKTDDKIPVVILTSHDSVFRKMDYNRFEADEVVSKSERELLKSCVNKRLKRLHQRELRCDDLRIDYEGMQVSVKRNGEWEDRKLAPQERKLLFFLSKRAGKVQAYDTIKVRVFDVQPDDVYGGMETTVAKLRKKIEPVDGERKYIVTVEGAGYRFDHSE